MRAFLLTMSEEGAAAPRYCGDCDLPCLPSLRQAQAAGRPDPAVEACERSYGVRSTRSVPLVTITVPSFSMANRCGTYVKTNPSWVELEQR